MTAATPTIDGFTGLRRIGQGGFSVVYEATQADLGRSVAVKVLNFDVADASARRRFDRECRAIGALSGTPGVVDIHRSAMTEDGRMAIVMELMTESLEGRVSAHGPMSPTEVCEMGSVLASALAEAHALEIAHRDIKPGNVLISRRGDPALSDFGISMVAEMETSSLTEASLSPPYAAPERFEGSAIDEHLADVYALGATLYFALTGAAPFGTSTSNGGISGLLNRILSQPVPDPTRPDVPADLVALLSSMMAKHPNDRPHDVMELSRRFAGIDTTVAPAPADPPDGGLDPSGRWWAVGLGSNDEVPPADGSPSSAATPRVSAIGPGPGQWPSATDYVASVQDPAAVVAPQLAGAEVTRGVLGMPVSASGQSTVVFHFDSAEGPLAARCFTRAADDGHVRYRALRAHLTSNPQPDLVAADWVEAGILVGDRSFPLVVMPWVQGCPLNEAVHRRLDQPAALRALADEWLAMLDRLSDAKVAHGDLQHGNVLVDDAGCFRLVDLDGVWVPTIAHLPAAERGHPNFQHPARDLDTWGPELDTFAGLVIYLSLLALAADASLWRFHMGENLVLTAEDFADPSTSDAFAALAASTDEAVRHLTATLRALCSSGAPPGGTVRALAARTGDVPPPVAVDDGEEITLPRERIERLLGERCSAEAAGTPAWWQDAPSPEATDLGGTEISSDVTSALAAAPSQRTSTLAALGRTSAISGLAAGVVAGTAGALLQSVLYPPGAGRAASAGVLAVLVAALATGLLAAWPHLTARAWAKGALMLAVGSAAGAAATGLVLLGADPYFYDQMTPVRAATPDDSTGAPALAFITIWVAIAAVTGVVSGALRSVRGAVSGVAGGVIGGVVGGTLCWAVTQPTVVSGALHIDGGDPATTTSIAATAGIIGLAVGLAHRVTRIASLTVIEGPLRGRTIDLDRSSTSIGSASRCTVVLRGDPTIGPLHARIDIDDGAAFVDPVIPVTINGDVALHRQSIRDGDILQVGGSFLRFERAGQ